MTLTDISSSPTLKHNLNFFNLFDFFLSTSNLSGLNVDVVVQHQTYTPNPSYFLQFLHCFKKKRLNRTTKTFYVINKTIIDIKRHNKYFSPIIVTLGYRNEEEGKRRAVCITTVNKSSKRRAKKFPLKRPESHFGMPNDNNKQLIFVQHHKTIPTQALLRFVRLS